MTIKALKTLIEPIPLFSSESILNYEIFPKGKLRSDIVKDRLTVKSRNIFSSLWYELQRHVITAIRMDKELNLIDQIIAYEESDDQFPPDIVKCFRLYCCLEVVKPSHILELGCGTSSMIINTYMKRAFTNCAALSVDNDASWINLTKNKITGVSDTMQSKLHHMFFCHKDENSTHKRIADFLLGATNCFIFLDAKVIDSDRSQGMDLIINILNYLPEKTTILIDSRYEAVVALQKLSTKLNKKISLITSTQMYDYEKDSDKRLEGNRRQVAASAMYMKSMSMYSIATLDD